MGVLPSPLPIQSSTLAFDYNSCFNKRKLLQVLLDPKTVHYLAYVTTDIKRNLSVCMYMYLYVL